VGETSANNKKSPADLIYLLENTVDRLKSKDLPSPNLWAGYATR